MKVPFWRQESMSASEIAETGQPDSRPEAPEAEADPTVDVTSSILMGVLGSPHAAEARPRKRKRDPFPSAHTLSVGARLNDARTRALEAAAKLAALADPKTAQAVSRVADQLRKQYCRLGFVGQVKAGKSSLINVLVEQSGLLPADINPCTSVVTRLNFGVPDKPNAGALFTFFTQDEWSRLSLGGRTRELTDRLFPNFDWSILRSQVRFIEERAKDKLGNNFDSLLGRHHFYEAVQGNLLVRYIGAEHPNPETPLQKAEGEFSDITKTADIFLDLGAFSFPTVVIDTPGVNDPFLVRDEITRQNLEAADICVVVVTARQPLSTTDLSLLRMLRGLKKDRIVIFINKTDEIRGGEEALRDIAARVSDTLKQEFPSSQFRVVLGSAALAHKALSHRLAAQGTPAFSEMGAPEENPGFGLPSLRNVADSTKAEEFFLRSGLLDLAVATSEMMSNSQIADTINGGARLIQAACRNLIVWLEIGADLICRAPAAAMQAEQELAEHQFGAVVDLRQKLAATFDVFSQRLTSVHDREARLIKERLSSALGALIPEALAEFANDGDASHVDVKLRIQLEDVFLKGIAGVDAALASEQKMLGSELLRLFESRGAPWDPMIVLGQPFTLAPSLAALSEPAALGSAAHLAKLVGAPGRSQDWAANLSDLIVADFAPIIEKLADEASRAFLEGASAFAARVQALTFGPIDTVIQEASLVLRDAQMQASGDTERRAQAIREKVLRLRTILETFDAHCVV